MALRVVFADDNFLVREGVTALMAEIPDIDGVTSATRPMFGGRTADERRLDGKRDGALWTGRLVCSVEDGLAVTLRASWGETGSPADADADVDAAEIRKYQARDATTTIMQLPKPSERSTDTCSLHQLTKSSREPLQIACIVSGVTVTLWFPDPALAQMGTSARRFDDCRSQAGTAGEIGRQKYIQGQ